MSASNRPLAIFAVATAAVAAVTLARAQTDPVRIALDSEQVVGNVAVGCTGVGQSKDDPRWKAYPIRVEASNPAGDLLANVAITLSGKGGAALASVRCAGPWVLLKPPPGDYHLEGWMPGSDLKHQFAPVSPPAGGQTIVTLVFPQS
jgi:hypothetical protein